ncbi:hypothetical protein BC830DRAFT_1124752 [Chytriomyces sp. MP71]|nr:hypothetical protein BC830DRAFT_1124752 [Chytriomyces sp. MP71]
MQAAEHTNTIKEDPILSVFRTFASLHGLNSFPMLQFSDSSHVSDAIVDAAKQANATIVFVPQSASKTSGTPTTPIAGTSTQGKYQSSWIGDDSTQQMRRVVTEVCGSLKCVSVVHFIDRGFMSLNARGGDTAGQGSALQSVFRPAGVAESSPLVGKELARPKPPRLNSAFFQSKIKVVLIVGGLKDASESEAVRLVQHVTGSQSVSTSVIFETYIVRLVRDAKANSANTTVEEEVQDVSLPNATTIQMETVDVVALTTQLAGLVKHHEDLVVIGETALKLDARVHFSDDSKQSSTSSAGLEQWLEYDCAASIAIVHGRK